MGIEMGKDFEVFKTSQVFDKHGIIWNFRQLVSGRSAAVATACSALATWLLHSYLVRNDRIIIWHVIP